MPRLAAAVLAGWIALTPLPGQCALDEADAASLDAALSRIGDTDAWLQPEADQAMRVFDRSAYTRDDFATFFADYFASAYFTNNLRDFLGYPIFFWGDPAQQLDLQRAMAPAMLDILTAGMEQVRASPETALLEVTPREDLLNAAVFFDDLAHFGALTRGESSALGARVGRLVADSYPDLLQASAQLDPSRQPHVPLLRAQVWIAIAALTPDTLERRKAIADITGLQGRRRTLWTGSAVLLHDNGQLSAEQLGVIQSYMNLTPRALGRPRHISVWDFLRPAPEAPNMLRAHGSVNIFGFQVTGYEENSFPPDVAASSSPVFSLVLAHEVNHVVDAVSLREGNVRGLEDRRQALIERAGTTLENYLRSNVLEQKSTDFFQKAPQEFIASIANQWFADSVRTLELALKRADNGYTEPLNQFLLFADLYSQGSNQTFFYEIDADGGYTRHPVHLTRNEAGQISSLRWQQTDYHFSYDTGGFVSGYSAK